jgi:pimeloyl-ACP methyl ester carboxylesterase
MATDTPVLLVHGIWDVGDRFNAMRAGLHRAGITRTRAVDLQPNDGSITIAAMAQQVARAAQTLSDEFEAPSIDLVGFSMGAVVSRYFIQRGGGRSMIRRFISISGPHSGTINARLSPVEAAREMRRHSNVLDELARDPSPWGTVEVHAWFTPWDLMIIPAHSSVLPEAAVRKFPVALHRWMVSDQRVIRALVETLSR